MPTIIQSLAIIFQRPQRDIRVCREWGKQTTFQLLMLQMLHFRILQTDDAKNSAAGGWLVALQEVEARMNNTRNFGYHSRSNSDETYQRLAIFHVGSCLTPLLLPRTSHPEMNAESLPT